ncbi:MAG: hypothetical protein R3B45_17030 [Bdellovibrionota bacterium]
MPKNRANQSIVANAFSRQIDRLTSHPSWFPYPAFIGFGLAIMLIGDVFFGLNPRVGNPAEAMYFNAKELQEGGIWISTLVKDNNIIVTTEDHKVFNIPLGSRDSNSIEDLTNYFKDQTLDRFLSVGLAKKTSLIESMVIISADQRLQYGHIKPVLLAIANAGISRYGFETKQLKN